MKHAGMLIFWLLCAAAYGQNTDTTQVEWREGYLDIHHINTGRGNSTFFLFPDGTTLLWDAGDLNASAFLKKNAPLKVSPARPNHSKTPGEWIAYYIQQSRKPKSVTSLDYLVVSHFHGDHYGELTPNSKQGSVSSFKRTGITDVGDLFTIGTLLDRGYPKYDFPVNLGAYYQEPESTFLNYLAFVNAKVKQGTRAEMLKAGSNHQILLKRNPQQYPEFKVQNVKVNGTIWTGNAEETVVHFTADSVLSPQGKFNENPLSMAIKISYGNFDYFTGADNTGLRGYGLPTWFDTETPMAKAIGKVEVMTLNHHGNRDATNETFLKATQPKVAIQQIWCSDQPGQEVMHRLGLKPKPDVFALHLQEETKTYLGFWLNQIYKSTDGHVMIRVSPGGKQFWVGVLDDTKAELSLKRWFGPYYCY